MSTDKEQSKIKEARDQLFIDTADQSRLTIVTDNLGVPRPKTGYSDDAWRAVAKTFAVNYKQIRTKFVQVLTEILGPRKTLVTSLKQDAKEGDTSIFVHDTTNFPQNGTLVLDQDKATGEVIKYCFITRSTNQIHLTKSLAYDHDLSSAASSPLRIKHYQFDTSLKLYDTSKFGSSGIVLVGAGTANEEAVTFSANNTAENILTLLSPLKNNHKSFSVSRKNSKLASSYLPNTYVLHLADTKKFPDSGFALLGKSIESFTADGASTQQVLSFTSLPFTDNELVGYRIVFDSATTTAALRDFQTVVESNSTTSITPTVAFPAIPVATDTIYIRPIVKYGSKTTSNLTLTAFLSELSFAVGTTIEVLEFPEIVQNAQAQVKKTGWEIFEVQRNAVDILIPRTIFTDLNLLSASYVHTEYTDLAPSTTTTSAAALGVTAIPVADASDFPLFGVVTINGTVRIAYSITNNNLLEVETFGGLPANVPTGASVVLYEPNYGVTDLLTGDIHGGISALFPGPYMYSPGTAIPSLATFPETDLVSYLAGPTKVSASSLAGDTALEVDTAAFYPLGSGAFPQKVIIGEATGNREEREVLDINLKHRVSGTVSTVNIGDTTITITEPAPTLGADVFPTASGYRVLLSKGLGNAEVVVVDSRAGNVLTLRTPTTNSHAASETIELLADVMTVDPLQDVHNGTVPVLGKTSLTPGGLITNPETVQKVYTEIKGISTLAYPASASFMLNPLVKAVDVRETLDSQATAPTTTIPIPSSISFRFPTTGGIITVSKDSRREEVLRYASRTGNTLTLDYPTKEDHLVGDLLVLDYGNQEIISYDENEDNTFSLSNPTVLNSNHQKTENIRITTTTSDPNEFGLGFPLTIPEDPIKRVQIITDLIRAAGIQINYILKD